MKKKLIVLFLIMSSFIHMTTPMKVRADETVMETYTNGSVTSEEEKGPSMFEQILEWLEGIGSDSSSTNTWTTESADKSFEQSRENDSVINSNLQTVVNSVMGSGGISLSDVYSNLNDVSGVKSTIDSYLGYKSITEEQLLYTKIAMYLSQYADSPSENLLNVIEKIERYAKENVEVDLSTIEFTDDKIIKGKEIKVNLKNAIQYIKDNYSISYAYKKVDNEYKRITVGEFIESMGLTEIYSCDRSIISSDTKITSAINTPAEVDSKEVKALSVLTNINSLSSKTMEAWIPYLDYKVRNSSASMGVLETKLASVLTYSRIFGGSLESEAVMKTMIGLFDTSKSGFSMSSVTGGIGDEELGIDSFGNIVSFRTQSILVSVMNNPVLMAIDGHETYNLTAYNQYSKYTGITDKVRSKLILTEDGNFQVSLKKKVVPPSEYGYYTEHWVQALMDKLSESSTEYIDNVLGILDVSQGSKSSDLVTFTGDSGKKAIESKGALMMNMEETSRNTSYTPYTHYQDLATSKGLIGNTGGYYQLSPNFDPAILSVSTPLIKSIYKETSSSWAYLEGHGAYSWYGVSCIDKDNIYDGEKDIYGLRREVVTFYKDSEDKEKWYSGYLYLPNFSGVVRNAEVSTERIKSCKDIQGEEIINSLQTYMSRGILDHVNVFEGWDRYQNYTQEALKKANSFKIAMENNQVADAWDSLSTENGYSYPLSNISSDDEVQKLVMLGVGIYGGDAYSDLKKNLDTKLSIFAQGAVESEYSEDYNLLFFSVMKNTSEETQKVKISVELSKDDAEAMKEKLSMEILNRIYYKLTHTVEVIRRVVAGALQSLHVKLNEAKIGSIFYITDESINSVLGGIPEYVIIIGMAILFIQLMVLLTKLAFGAKFDQLKRSVIGLMISAVMLAIPLLILGFTEKSIEFITDNFTQSVTMKYGVYYLEGSLNDYVATSKVEEESGNAEYSYFKETFAKTYFGTLSINQINTETSYVNLGMSEIEYEEFKLDDMHDIINKLEDDNPDNLEFHEYNGDSFVPALHEHYNKDIFYYFVDYYMHLYCKQKSLGTSALGSNWQTELESTLLSTKGTFRKFYSKRSNVYGITSGLSESRVCISDIFGLGTLFFNGTLQNYMTSPDSRGFYYPIEYFDTTLLGDMSKMSLGNNVYWERIKLSPYLKGTSKAITETLEEKGATNLLYAPVYSAKRLAVLRPNLVLKDGSVLDINPQIIADKGIYSLNNVKTQSLLLEKAVWELNQNIYEQICKYFDLELTTISDYSDLLMLASISSFEFNKMFGDKVGDILAIENTQFNKSSMDTDMLMRAIFLDPEEVAKSDDTMYTIVADKGQVITGIIIVITEGILLAFVAIRLIHLIQIFFLSAGSSLVAYVVKRNIRNKCWLGVVTQVLFLLVSHAIIVVMMNLVVLKPFPSGWLISFGVAILMQFMSIIAVIVEVKMVIFLFRNMRDMGGQVVANSVKSALANISGKIKGTFSNGEMNSNSDLMSVKASNVEVDSSTNSTGESTTSEELEEQEYRAAQKKVATEDESSEDERRRASQRLNEEGGE